MILKKIIDKLIRLDKFLDIKSFYDKTARFYDIAHHVQTLWADNIHRIAVVKAAMLQEGELVIDIGTGTSMASVCAVEKTYPARIRVIGIDLSTQILKEAKKNIAHFHMVKEIFPVNADARFLPLRPDLFEKIISVYGMGGIQINVEKAFLELFKVSKQSAIISVGEMSAPPQDKSLLKRKIHEICVEPLINLVWQFKDLNLSSIFKKFRIKILKRSYYNTKYFGSMTLLLGKLQNSL
ncbi:MAG: class I SAM-dependent methyltransferase [Promethearchaeia archaeon]